MGKDALSFIEDKQMVKTAMAKKLKQAGVGKRSKKSVWKGPESDHDQGGVTQSMLARYVVCGERFRIATVEGLRPALTFSHRIEYGNMWHICEEEYAKQPRGDNWVLALMDYCKKLVQKYKLQQVEIEKWYNVCKIQFPTYVRHWKKARKKLPFFQEKIFQVPYKLPSGRTVYLKGKWDSVYIVGKGKAAAFYLQENKTKGEIVEHQIKNQLEFDLQTMLYLIALQEYFKSDRTVYPYRIKGVLYNVVRRPLSGGKDSIRQLKPNKKNPDGESLPEYYNRLGGLIASDPEHYFMRWQSKVSQKDIAKFETQFLNPVLENNCDDYEWWEYCLKSGHQVYDYTWRKDKFPHHTARHFRLPYGVYNVLAEGGSTEYDEYLDNGNKVGLQVTKDLFPELHDG